MVNELKAVHNTVTKLHHILCMGDVRWFFRILHDFLKLSPVTWLSVTILKNITQQCLWAFRLANDTRILPTWKLRSKNFAYLSQGNTTS